MLDRFVEAAGHALGEVVLVASNSGVNAVPVEVALGSGERVGPLTTVYLARRRP